jgi:RDD family
VHSVPSTSHSVLAAPAGEPFASVSRRSLAWIVDVVAVTVLIFVGVAVLDAVFGPTVRMHPEATALEDVLAADPGRVVLNALLAAGLSAAYFVVPWVLLGGSPAQLALRMRVRDREDGETLPLGRALARWILLFPPFATVSALTAGMPLVGALVWGAAVVWYLLLLLTTARSDTNQGLHDRIARSVVRKLSRQAAYRAAHVR